jgi:hypothetical protein
MAFTSTVRSLLFALCCTACGGQAHRPTPTTAPPASDPSPPPTPTEVSAGAPVLTASATPPPQPEEPPPPEPVSLLAFERVLEEPIKSIAVGKPPRIAALGDEPWLLDTEGWQKKALPKQYALSADSRVEIFFGRDNRPRLMGTTSVSPDGSGTQAVYLRLKNAGWRKEPSEIGRLGGLPHGGLFGVLGHDDPEVVCKVGDVCIVKRLTGWTTLPSGPGMPRVFMQGGEVWALHPDRVSALEGKGWQDLPAPPWSKPTGLWGDPSGTVWVSVAAENALYRFEEDAWSKVPSPVKAPRGLWGTSPSDVWVTGDDGAGHYDGSTWRRVVGPEGPLEVATGAGAQDVWLGGRSGLWHGTKAR